MPKIIIGLEVRFCSLNNMLLGKEISLLFFFIKKFENILVTTKKNNRLTH